MNREMTCAEVKIEVEKSGLKIKHLAKQIGVSAYTLGAYLNGKRTLNLSAKILLFGKLNLDTSSLVKDAA